jgi:hypothetical protein
MGLVTTLSIDIQQNSFECHYAECCYAECHDYLNVMLSVIKLNVIMLNVVMLSVAAPVNYHGNFNPNISNVKILW